MKLERPVPSRGAPSWPWATWGCGRVVLKVRLTAIHLHLPTPSLAPHLALKCLSPLQHHCWPWLSSFSLSSNKPGLFLPPALCLYTSPCWRVTVAASRRSDDISSRHLPWPPSLKEFSHPHSNYLLYITLSILKKPFYCYLSLILEFKFHKDRHIMHLVHCWIIHNCTCMLVPSTS